MKKLLFSLLTSLSKQSELGGHKYLVKIIKMIRFMILRIYEISKAYFFCFEKLSLWIIVWLLISLKQAIFGKLIWINKAIVWYPQWNQEIKLKKIVNESSFYYSELSSSFIFRGKSLAVIAIYLDIFSQRAITALQREHKTSDDINLIMTMLREISFFDSLFISGAISLIE